jgi:hypothetical protein
MFNHAMNELKFIFPRRTEMAEKDDFVCCLYLSAIVILLGRSQREFRVRDGQHATGRVLQYLANRSSIKTYKSYRTRENKLNLLNDLKVLEMKCFRAFAKRHENEH